MNFQNFLELKEFYDSLSPRKKTLIYNLLLDPSGCEFFKPQLLLDLREIFVHLQSLGLVSCDKVIFKIDLCLPRFKSPKHVKYCTGCGRTT